VLILLDDRTWTSGDDTAKFVEHIHVAMRIGVHICCVHEFPAVVGPPRHACDFEMMVPLHASKTLSMRGALTVGVFE
jgi:hypothetical protein